MFKVEYMKQYNGEKKSISKSYRKDDSFMGKKVLLIYANEYFLTSPVYPFGLDIIAQHLRENGHTVCINLPFLRYQDTSKGIETILNDFQPDIAGIAIRNIDTAMACDPGGTFQLPGIKTHFFLPGIARIITVIKKNRPDTIAVGEISFIFFCTLLQKTCHKKQEISADFELKNVF